MDASEYIHQKLPVIGINFSLGFTLLAIILTICLPWYEINDATTQCNTMKCVLTG
jgi:hypothetical protein